MLQQQEFAFGNIHDIPIKVMSYGQSEFSWICCVSIYFICKKTLEFGIDIYASFSNDKSLLSFLAISLTSDGDSVVHWGGCREKSVWEL